MPPITPQDPPEKDTEQVQSFYNWEIFSVESTMTTPLSGESKNMIKLSSFVVLHHIYLEPAPTKTHKKFRNMTRQKKKSRKVFFFPFYSSFFHDLWLLKTFTTMFVRSRPSNERTSQYIKLYDNVGRNEMNARNGKMGKASLEGKSIANEREGKFTWSDLHDWQRAFDGRWNVGIIMIGMDTWRRCDHAMAFTILLNRLTTCTYSFFYDAMRLPSFTFMMMNPIASELRKDLDSTKYETLKLWLIKRRSSPYQFSRRFWCLTQVVFYRFFIYFHAQPSIA